MALKTFNLDEKVYKEFSKHCKKEGISMSRKLENFIRDEVAKLQGKKPTRTNAGLKPEKSSLKPSHHSFSKYC